MEGRPFVLIQVRQSGRVDVWSWDESGRKTSGPTTYRDWTQVLSKRKIFAQPGPLVVREVWW